MIGFSFLAGRSAVQNAMENFMREQASDNLTDKEKQMLEHLLKSHHHKTYFTIKKEGTI
jgi:hypothetical protein